ncbi:hypothetical protein [Sphingomonas phyllosphaerae]|uniref:hypothetical protein n=1 Tax=Sphingomonas phyllosphaerae TaxID=257003 RepID=UPI002412FE26|nr:hypothetical protein [Sphingomonas phyllosphaerae]
MIASRRTRVGARYASLIAAPLLGTACGSHQQRASDATIARAAAQAQASVSAYERSGARHRDAAPAGTACGPGMWKVATSGHSPGMRARFDVSSDRVRCAM